MKKEINFEEVNDRQKLELKKALLDYQFIMKNIDNVKNRDFQDVYYKFYLSARWAVYGNQENRTKYFEVLNNCKDETDLGKIVETLHDELNNINSPKKVIGYDFSVATKMLHTHHPEMPIYDSKIHNYLSKFEDVSFKWQNVEPDKKVEQIKEDYQNLVDWYKKFQESDEGKNWIAWFNDNFPDLDKEISGVKKIDFIIFALT